MPTRRAGTPDRLLVANPALWPLQPDWQPLLDAFLVSPAGVGLRAFLLQRLSEGAVVYPPEPLRALHVTAQSAVRVVILGQDPYHGPGQAEGLAFSVAHGTPCPPSLRNLHAELRRDLGCAVPDSGSLLPWAQQGVLLLNTCLTVEEGQPASHAGRGWEVLTDAIIKAVSESASPKVFLLWGAHAQKKAALVDPERHLVLTANHPSPLSARRGPSPFLGCGHFSAANRWLESKGRPAVDWALPARPANAPEIMA